jgi:hypothetical protein
MMTRDRRNALMKQIADAMVPTGDKLIGDIVSGATPTKSEAMNVLVTALVPELLKHNSGELVELLAIFIAEYNLEDFTKKILTEEMRRALLRPDEPEPGLN